MISVITMIASVVIIFAAFAFTCGTLLESKYSRKTSAMIAGGFLLGILLVQTVFVLFAQDQMLVLTLLPLTAYLPAVICVHVLSGTGFFQTCAVWSSGVLVYFTLIFWKKLLQASTIAALPSYVDGLIELVLLAVLAAALALLVQRVVRAPFQAYVRQADAGWLRMAFPLLVVFLLLSYFSESTTAVQELVLVLAAALVVTFTLARSLALTVSARRDREAEEAMKRQMDLQRQDYESLNKKMELGRTYRHDLRHHLKALDALLQQNKGEQAAAYISKLGGQLTRLEQERWCENTTLNAVLASSIAQARQEGCVVGGRLSLPAELPFDELDVCVILSNALENATRACSAVPAERRKILVSAVLSQDHRLNVTVQNPCDKPMTFDADGFPVVALRSGHGIGLRSVAAVAKKYNGLSRCTWADGVFTLKAVLFDPSVASAPIPAPAVVQVADKRRKMRQKATAAIASVFLCIFFLNCMPTVAQAVESIPVLGALVRVVDLHTWNVSWGDTAAKVDAPVVEGNGGQTLTDQTNAWIAQMQDTFVGYVSRKFEGYVGMDSSYTVLRDDDAVLCLRFFATVNVGGSVEYGRCLTLDKQTGQVLQLSDLFAPGSDYVTVISENIRGQMKRQMEEGVGDYFLPGGIWSDEECFQQIDPDQNFYVDSMDMLVLMFDEFEVAPGSMGMPEFVIPLAELSDLLANPL